MTVFTVEELDTWLRQYDGTDRDGNPTTRHRPEFPIRIYLQWIQTRDGPDTFSLKINLEVTEFGEQIMSMNAPNALSWIENNFSSYPSGLRSTDVRDLQQICEYVETGRSGPMKIDVAGGTFTVDSEEMSSVNGRPRTTINATITTNDVLTITVEDAIRATIDTTDIR